VHSFLKFLLDRVSLWQIHLPAKHKEYFPLSFCTNPRRPGLKSVFFIHYTLKDKADELKFLSSHHDERKAVAKTPGNSGDQTEPGETIYLGIGWKSPIYCDNRKTLSFPHIREFIKSEMCNLIF